MKILVLKNENVCDNIKGWTPMAVPLVYPRENTLNQSLPYF